MNDRRMMKTTLLILTVLFFSGVCPAQIVELDLQKCRKMAVENSKKLQSAEQQGQKAGLAKKLYGVIYYLNFRLQVYLPMYTRR